MHDTTTARGSFWLATTPQEPTHPQLEDGRANGDGAAPAVAVNGHSLNGRPLPLNAAED